MTTTPKRKLIEVALPLEKINRESAREKSIRHGHPSTLHLWWARRPLAACRAVLFAQLVDDPSSHPDQFPTEEAVAAERQRLFRLIERLVVWENTTDDALLREAHEEILKSTDGSPPPILDPFAGGGSIPLEAQRLGLEAHASDLNPVPVLINKALIEIPPKWAGLPPVFPGAADEKLGKGEHSDAMWPKATGLAEDVRRYGKWMRDEAEKRIGHLYPKAELESGEEADVIAWIWARTVKCPSPACGIQMPLVKSWWLGKKKDKEAYVIPRVEDGNVVFEIGHDAKQAPKKDTDGSVRRTGAVCIGCGEAVPLKHVRDEGKAGRMGQKLMAIVAEGNRRRIYLAPNEKHEQAAQIARPGNVPDTELPTAALGFRVQGYGMTHHADLFTSRQLTALTTYSALVREARTLAHKDAAESGLPSGPGLEAGGTGAEAYADAVATYLAFAVSRTADYCSTITTWASNPQMEILRGAFSRQAVQMTWDFAEGNIFGPSSGTLEIMIPAVCKPLERLPAKGPSLVTQRDASTRPYTGVLVSTDPPYYDNVGYADLSDFFYVWLRSTLGTTMPSILGTMLTPKREELVADPFRHNGKGEAEKFFESGFDRIFERIRFDAYPDAPISVFYAFKQSETDDHGEASTGWETLLAGLLRSGWAVTGTWPVRTERAGRTRHNASNALASSIVLACRPRPESAETTTRSAFLTALKDEMPKKLGELQQGAIAPVDLAQAAIGPGMAVFSRYAQVLESDGKPMSVHSALILINQALDEVLSEQEGDFDSDTRFCVQWFKNFGWSEGSFGDADNLARGRNTSVEGVQRGGVFRAVAGKAKLLPFSELPSDWHPETDERISLWEVVLHLAKALDEEGGDAAARLMAAARTRVDMDVAQELAYLLFAICEKRGQAQDAILFNGLGQSWSDLTAAARKQAASAPKLIQDGFTFDEE
jgi:putative DNA methylase